MSDRTADVVVCGAGIAGVSAAYHLAVGQGIKQVLLVDSRPPLSLTSDKSTECYRNWWPGPGDAMVRLMNRSIDLLESWADETGNAIHLNRRGYLFATADPAKVDDYLAISREAEASGAGPLRIHRGRPDDPAYLPAPSEGFHGLPSGADLILDRDLIRAQFPYLTDSTVAVLHARRCGWFSGQQLGALLLDRAKRAGAELMRGRVLEAIGNEHVASVRIAAESGEVNVATERFVLAAGPETWTMGERLGLDLPIFCELHAKVAMPDHLGVVPREAGLVIWSDEQALSWTEEERGILNEDPETAWLTSTMPAGVHTRPEGAADSPTILMLWTYDIQPVQPVFPPHFDEIMYPEVTLRGLATMIPGMRAYVGKMPKPFVDGGYYAKTKENRLLACPLPLEGAFIIGALSGYGLMSSPAAGELVAAHVAGTQLPDYAHWFSLERYQDPDYLGLLENWGASGQL